MAQSQGQTSHPRFVIWRYLQLSHSYYPFILAFIKFQSTLETLPASQCAPGLISAINPL